MENSTKVSLYSQQDTEDYEEAMLPLGQPFNFLFGSIVTSIIAANAFIFTILVSYKKLHSLPCFALLTSLSFTDLMTGCTLGFYWITFVMEIDFNNLTCQLIIAASSAVVVASFNHAIVVAADRLYAVLSPFNYKKKRNPIVSVIIVVAIWSVSVAMTFCVVFTYTDSTIQHYTTITQCTTTVLWGKNIGVVSIILIVYFTIAYVMIFSIYVTIYLKVKRQTPQQSSKRFVWNKGILSATRREFIIVPKGKDCQNTVTSSSDKSKLERNIMTYTCLEGTDGKGLRRISDLFSHGQDPRRASVSSATKERKVHKMLFLLTGVLLLCYLPTMCCYFLRVMGYQSDLLQNVESWTHSLIVINSAINPFLYACRLPGFQTAVNTTCRTRSQKRNFANIV